MRTQEIKNIIASYRARSTLCKKAYCRGLYNPLGLTNIMCKGECKDCSLSSAQRYHDFVHKFLIDNKQLIEDASDENI